MTLSVLSCLSVCGQPLEPSCSLGLVRSHAVTRAARCPSQAAPGVLKCAFHGGVFPARLLAACQVPPGFNNDLSVCSLNPWVNRNINFDM